MRPSLLLVRSTLLATSVGALLAGCAGGSPPSAGHVMYLWEGENAFHLTRSIRRVSIAFFTDARGNRWPQGLTLSAEAGELLHDGPGKDSLSLRVRHDEPLPGTDIELAAAYELARQRQGQLAQSCRQVTFQPDGQPVVLPVQSLTVSVLTNRDRMPEPPTDHEGDPVADFVADNPADRIVLSTGLLMWPEPGMLERLAHTSSLYYEACGHKAEARPEEIDGLLKVHQWVQEGAAQRPVSQ